MTGTEVSFDTSELDTAEFDRQGIISTWDKACDLQRGCRYDNLVRVLGGGGETVTDSEQVGAAVASSTSP